MSTQTESQPTLGKITRTNGVADAISYSVPVTYQGEPTSTVTFVGNEHGKPIVMITPANPDGVFVTDPERFGSFGPEWVRRFFTS